MKSIFNPDKSKIKGLLILIIGSLIPFLIKYLLLIYEARILGPEKFKDFLNYLNTNIPLNVILTIAYIIWIYVIVSFVLNLRGRK